MNDKRGTMNYGSFFAMQKTILFKRDDEDVIPYGLQTAKIIANYRL